MNIEAANLTSLAPSSSPVESGVLPVSSSGVVSEGFSDALVTQIGLLSDLKAGSLLPAQAPNLTVLQEVDGSQSVPGLAAGGEAALQDFAASLGNDLPPSYKTKDEVDHAAALAAVTDTLKYISMGTAADEKAIQVEQNMKEVVAMAASAERTAAAAEVEQDMAAAVVETKQSTAMLIEAERNVAETEKKTAAMVAAAERNTAAEVERASAATVAEAAQNMAAAAEQDMKNAPVMDAPMQMDRDHDMSERKQAEGETQAAGSEDNSGTNASVAVMMLPTTISTAQEKTVNDLTPASMSDEKVWAPSIKSAASDGGKQGQMDKASGTVLRSETVFQQPTQDKQSFNLKYVENTGQAEKIGRVESQTIDLNVEKALPRAGSDVAMLNRSVVDHKADIPAITKPLSHPEWNKDLGERIVWMSSRAIPAAEIRLNPQHLGPISVRVDVVDDQATVVFTAQHAATIDAIEASIPKLREMMGAQQLNLLEVNVSHGATSDHGRSQAQNFADGRAQQQGTADVAMDGVDGMEQEIESGRAVVSKGLLSLYA